MDLKIIEKKILDYLKKRNEVIRFEDLIEDLKVDQSSLMRSLLEMNKENLVKIEEADRIEIKMTNEGKKVIESGLPECNLVELLKEKGEMHIKDIPMKDKNIAIAWAKNKDLIEIKEGIVKLKRNYENKDKKEIEWLKEMGDREYYMLNVNKEILDILKRRKFIEIIPKTVRFIKLTEKGKGHDIEIEEEIKEITPEVILNKEWKRKKIKEYNIYAQSYETFPGKKHFVNQAIDYIRQIWLDMGFEEMKGKILCKSFWNFDALFVPQNHPAREMQDTFYVDISLNEEIDKEVLNKVKAVHERGDRRSIGWGYKYSYEKANQAVLRTHTTVLSALTLYDLDIKDLPKKYFAIGKVFRNETLDWKHLFEFYQVEGIVVDENLNFRHLLGYLKEFFKKMGYENIRVRPAYFPYTELSVEIEVLIPSKGWTELGGAGIFRAEVVKPLLGKEIPVLAWGLGLERIIMNYYGFKDIRDIYTDNINLLRNTKRWLQ